MVNNKNVSILPHEDCCGCMGCGDVCPKQCIAFSKDEEGFLYPQIDEDLCICCGKCTKVCPELNPSYNSPSEKVFAAYALNDADRRQGSSGGMFGLLAEEMVARGGVVWGAAFDENLKLRHFKATRKDELGPLMRSKYLQSNTEGCYKQIASDLKNNVPTLFCGTSCQCNALLNYIGDRNENLYVVDLICHGVPSQDLFDRTIDYLEAKDGCKILDFTFRSKYKGALHPHAFTYRCVKNGKEKTLKGLHYQNPFYFGFQKYITLRPSCYRCKWTYIKRSSDITLADFWGIEKLNPALDAKSGVSKVIVNTAKGQELFNALISNNKIWREEFDVSQVASDSEFLNHPTALKPERAVLFKDLNTCPFEEVVRKHLVSKKQWVFDTYYGMPGFLRRIVRKIMDKRMRYE